MGGLLYVALAGEVDAWFNTHSNPRALTTEAQVTDATGDPPCVSTKTNYFFANT